MDVGCVLDGYWMDVGCVLDENFVVAWMQILMWNGIGRWWGREGWDGEDRMGW